MHKHTTQRKRTNIKKRKPTNNNNGQKKNIYCLIVVVVAVNFSPIYIFFVFLCFFFANEPFHIES